MVRGANMLDFRVYTFICVCKYMNFTKAADELNLTQPCVSQHIRYLENYYGLKLFTYNNKELRLTKAGKDIYNAMLSFRHDEILLKGNIHLPDQSRKTLRFGATQSIGKYYLPNKLVRFLQHDLSTRIDLTISDTRDLMQRLDDGSIDFAMIEGFFRKSDYDHILIKREDLVAVCGPGYRTGRIGGIADLFPCHLFVREIGSGTREVFCRYLMENGYTLDRFSKISTVSDPQIILEMLAHDLGISFLYRSVVENKIRSGSLLPLTIPDFYVSHEFNFIWSRGSIFSAFFRSIFSKMLNGPD